MKKITTITMNKKMSVVNTLQLRLTYVSLLVQILAWNNPAYHTRAKY